MEAATTGNGIAVDRLGNAYVIGQTQSTNFPAKNPAQPANGGNWDAFVTELNPSGSALLHSSYRGGSFLDYGYGVAVDSAGDAYVTGTAYSVNFPTIDPLQSANAGYSGAFVAKITSDLTLTPQIVNFGNQTVGTGTPLVSDLINTGTAT